MQQKDYSYNQRKRSKFLAKYVSGVFSSPLVSLHIVLRNDIMAAEQQFERSAGVRAREGLYGFLSRCERGAVGFHVLCFWRERGAEDALQALDPLRVQQHRRLPFGQVGGKSVDALLQLSGSEKISTVIQVETHVRAVSPYMSSENSVRAKFKPSFP